MWSLQMQNLPPEKLGILNGCLENKIGWKTDYVYLFKQVWLFYNVFFCATVSGEGVNHGQPAVPVWLWTERRRLGVHVFLCGKWLLAPLTISWDQVRSQKPLLFFPLLCSVMSSDSSLFSNREGAIDRLVGIYKDVVHRTGVSVSTSLYSYAWSQHEITFI